MAFEKRLTQLFFLICFLCLVAKQQLLFLQNAGQKFSRVLMVTTGQRHEFYSGNKHLTDHKLPLSSVIHAARLQDMFPFPEHIPLPLL